jgi:eukaryotic-like serine/threonine-protein kinase
MSSNPIPVDQPDSESADSAVSQFARLGKYAIKGTLGSGGMGNVYQAVDTENNRDVALKILPRERAENPALVKRFQQEAAAAQQLRHENIVSVIDAGQADGFLYIALEYIDGTDVAKLLKGRTALPLRRSLEIVKQVARALDHAFKQGIVHRDVKPSNMLIKRNGTVKLTDMGLARSVDETLDSGVTRVGTTVGTVDYMAPEQAKDSKAADVRSDIYSLGCAWYHMLTGSPPFPKGSLTNKLYAHISNPRPDPRDINPEIPEQIVNIVRRMMSRDPAKRYPTPAELLEALERVSFRGDAFSNRFLSVLSDVVQDAEAEPAVIVEEAPQSLRRRVATRRRTRRRRKRSSDWLPEFGRVLGIALGGLLTVTALWWVVVAWFPGK